MSKLTIKSIAYQNILENDFLNMTVNNIIQFSRAGIAVVYGPNGTGKTTLTKAFSCVDDTSHFDIDYNGTNVQDDSSFFHIVQEHKNRNIIKGETQDFILGDDIRREHELKNLLDQQKAHFLNNVVGLLKEFGILSKSSKLFELFDNRNYQNALKDISNNKNRGKDLSYTDISEIFTQIIQTDLEESEELTNKINFLKSDLLSTKSVIKLIETVVQDDIQPNAQIAEIEQNEDAINILNKYPNIHRCIVCDNQDISIEHLTASKVQNKQRILDSLNEKVKVIIDSIKGNSLQTDPFHIKSIVLNACETGDIAQINTLIEDINITKEYYVNLFENKLVDLYSSYNIEELNVEYTELIERAIELTDEDECYIRQIIRENIRDDLTIERDDNKNIRIYIGGNELLENSELPLSTGEQNFISLSFELLKAKNNGDAKVVVLDDPISSFDSIYKNRIIFAILKILESKDCIILTHNIDVLRLLDAQYSKSFNLYMFSNGQNSTNGFIKVSENEKAILLNLSDLISFFRTKLSKVVNFEAYLMSMIPFMRGFSHLLIGIRIGPIYEILTNLMHGYKTAVVNIKDVYISLFGEELNRYYNSDYNISVENLLEFVLSENTDIVNPDEYPLLNQTLKHSLIFLQARLIVEKTLVNKFNIDTDVNKQLGQIIDAAFPSTNPNTISKRIALASKKTLINEFNHFEGNLSIFQPAIDISNQALIDEYNTIKSLMDEINQL